VIAANMQLNYATGKRIEFMSLDETVTETAEELYEKSEETKAEETAEQLEAVNKVMEEDRELLSKLANGVSLNPADRQRIKNLEWLIDRKRK
jgi:Na+/phosphate symporter